MPAPTKNTRPPFCEGGDDELDGGDDLRADPLDGRDGATVFAADQRHDVGRSASCRYDVRALIASVGSFCHLESVVIVS